MVLVSRLNRLNNQFVMSRLTAWIAALLILIGSVWSQVRPATAFAFRELDYVTKNNFY